MRSQNTPTPNQREENAHQRHPQQNKQYTKTKQTNIKGDASNKASAESQEEKRKKKKRKKEKRRKKKEKEKKRKKKKKEKEGKRKDSWFVWVGKHEIKYSNKRRRKCDKFVKKKKNRTTTAIQYPNTSIIQ